MFPQEGRELVPPGVIESSWKCNYASLTLLPLDFYLSWMSPEIHYFTNNVSMNGSFFGSDILYWLFDKSIVKTTYSFVFGL